MPAPTFLCIGAQKGGTTWLARAVQQHPEVGTGKKKELHFFNHQDAFAKGLDWYEAQFRSNPRHRAVGEFTPNYWWTTGTPTTFNDLGSADRVADAYPDLRLIVCLRDPVDRAVSAYFHHMKAGRYPPSVSLLEATKAWPDIREFGCYGTQLDAWLNRFPLESFLFLVYEEEIRPDAAKAETLRRVFEHIGVDPSFTPKDTALRRNEQGSHFDIRLKHASTLAQHLMKRLPERARAWSHWDIKVSDADRQALAAEYVPEVARLEQLLERTMPWSS